MRAIYFILIIICFGTIFSCSINYDLITHRNEEVDFRRYKTYAIVHDDHGFELNSDTIHKHHIDAAIKKEFERIGYVESNYPDLHIFWFVKVDTKLEPGLYNTYYQRWRSPKAIEVHEYQEGALVIDLVDTDSGEVIWHAKVKGEIDEKMKDVQTKVKKVVKEIFKSYKADTGIDKIESYVFK
ncbi:MAG: DUF4136 domain-containing protein [Saprospiraceae bacterium]|nr:DUF4136 domain-containing protein [Saprospiraceae bacterium]